MSKDKEKLPALLAFERKLEVSDALMFSGNWEDINNPEKWKAIHLNDKRNRATQSQFGATEEQMTAANLVHGDEAALPFDADTLKVSFTLRILGNLAPSICDKPEYQKILADIIENYKQTVEFTELANRYANNIANARFLWRNRVGAENICVQVKHNGKKIGEFSSYDYSLKRFTNPEKGTELFEMAQIIKEGLSNDSFTYLEIDAFVKIGRGQMVYPSQEMVLNIPKGEKSKYLFQLNGVAAMHSQKLGNALRTIDTWYENNTTGEIEPIAVEPYGSVTTRGKAYRPSKNDFYTLLKKWTLDKKEPELEQQHYIMAVLVRGGVFGESGKD
jgi:CRISPR-associated protein Csy3